MKVANICIDDWANFMFQQHEALLSVGIDSVSYKVNRHPFNYDKEANIILPNEIQEAIKDCTHVIIYHSDTHLRKFTHEGQKVTIYHTGTRFRSLVRTILADSEGCSHLIALPEFKKHVNAPYIVGAVDTEDLLCAKEISKPYVVAHYPSNPSVKGSSLIVDAFKDMPNFKYSLDRVGYNEHLNRLSLCDIYIELFAPTQGGNDYGSFGMTALEASAMCKIVLTQNITGKDLYKQTYGESPLIFIDSIEDLKQKLNVLLSKSNEEITELSCIFAEWVHEQHGYKSTGNRLHKFLHEL
jgi:hypothetical protein